MPASVLTVHVQLARGCPACGDARCANPAECLFFLTSRPWADCEWCDGSGWASESAPAYNPLAIFCAGCNGSGLDEYSTDSIDSDEISEGAKQRHAAHVARLAELVGPARLEVAA